MLRASVSCRILYSHKKHEKAQRNWTACAARRLFAIRNSCAFSYFSWLTIFAAYGGDSPPGQPESLIEVTGRLAQETSAAYEACRFSALSKDYFSRFSRD